MPAIISRIKEAFSKNTNISYQDKIFRYKLKNLYRIGLAVALVLVLCLVFKLQADNKVYTEAETTLTMEKVGTQTSEYEYYNGNLLVYSKDGISAYNTKGEQLFNQTYEMQSPLVSVCGDYAVVGDYKGSSIYVMDSSGLKGQIETNMMIQSLQVSEGGVVTTILDDGDVTWVNIYAQTGELIAKIKTTMNQTGYPLACAMSPDNVKLAVSYLTSGIGQVNMKVAFYNFGDVGQNESERLVSAEDMGGQLVPFLAYPTNETAIAISDSKLMFFKGKQIPKLTASVDIEEEVQSVFYNENQVALVFNNSQSSDKYRIITYDFNGKEKLNTSFDVEYKNIIVQNEQLLIYSESELLILNKRGEERYKGDLGEEIVELIPISSKNKFLVVTGDSMKHIQLK